MTHFTRILFTGSVAGVLCLCGALSAEAQDIFLRPAMESFVDRDTLLVFPAQVDTFQKVRVRKNENPVFGTVVRYENEDGTCADVYIYSLDTGAKPVQRDMYEKHCRETDQGILDMPAQNPKINSVTHIEAPGRKVPGDGYESHYRIRNGATEMDSVLYLALYRGKLIKIRISYTSGDTDEIQHAFLFIDAVAAMLTKEKAADEQKPESTAKHDTPEDSGTDSTESGTSRGD